MNTSEQRGAKIEIFIPDGSTEGVWIIERDPDWNGIVLYCPKNCYTTIRGRVEFSWPGIYILREQSDEQIEPTIYIGEGDPVRDRLDDHFKNKPFWNEAIVCVGVNGKSDKGRIQYLEARLILLAKQAKHCKIEQNSMTLPTLTPSQTSSAETYLNKLLSILRIMGLKAFEKTKSLTAASVQETTANLEIESKGISAKGGQVSSGFVVRKDSQAVLNEVPLASHGLKALRKSLREKEILVPDGDHLKFAHDHEFDSPSGAAAVVLGRSANGYIEWKNEDGTKLKDLEEKKLV